MKRNKEIVICRCGRKEYYDLMYWYNGISTCRECTYTRWEKESHWKRSVNEYVFPLYEDGVDYSEH